VGTPIKQSTASAWLCLLVMAVMAVGACKSLGDEIANGGHTGGLAQALGLRPSNRIREGHVPNVIPSGTGDEEAQAGAATVQDPPSPAPAGETAGPSPAEGGEALTIGESARITGTGGVGVVLRSLPRPDARVPRGLLENARVTVLDRSGDGWIAVRAENGLEGWVPTQYVGRDS
jgi:hypothetical protein